MKSINDLLREQRAINDRIEADNGQSGTATAAPVATGKPRGRPKKVRIPEQSDLSDLAVAAKTTETP
jgi:hypothetical protein